MNFKLGDFTKPVQNYFQSAKGNISNAINSNGLASGMGNKAKMATEQLSSSMPGTSAGVVGAGIGAGVGGIGGAMSDDGSFIGGAMKGGIAGGAMGAGGYAGFKKGKSLMS